MVCSLTNPFGSISDSQKSPLNKYNNIFINSQEIKTKVVHKNVSQCYN